VRRRLGQEARTDKHSRSGREALEAEEGTSGEHHGAVRSDNELQPGTHIIARTCRYDESQISDLS
jgi:hypothetical protein